MNIATALLCIGTTLIGAGIFFLTRLFNAGRQKNPAATSAAEKQTPRTGRLIWILYLSIALSLAYWMIWGALFFLIIVWLLRLDPGEEASTTVGDNEKKTARRIYTWLFWSSLITVPIFVVQLFKISSTSSTVNDQVLTALIPLILHIPLLLGLTSKSAFVYRHTQQGILLIALRAGMASLTAVNLDNHLDYALLLFFFGNGPLWLMGSIVGWNQITNSTCWFMQRKGEKAIIAETVDNLSAQKYLEQSQQFIHRYKADEAKQHALTAFRNGDREVKAQAVKLLITLDEVEKF